MKTSPVRSILLPQVLSRRTLPVNLRNEDLELFSGERERLIPAVELRELSAVRISPDGLLFKRGRILPESFAFPFLRDEWKTRSVVKFLGRSYLKKTRPIDEEVVWITDTWSGGYFHWLSDVLPKLFVVKDLLKARVLLLPHAYSKFEFVESSLKAFEVNNVEFIRPDEVVRCRRLLAPTPIAPSGHFRSEIIQGVRGQLLEHFGVQSSTAAVRVYISRARAPKRRIANESAVLTVLKEHGFEIVHAEDLSFADQVKVFSQAAVLVSSHGAGLTNMLFMSSRRGVLELRHHADKINNCYFTMASALDLDYYYQTCSSTDSRDPHSADVLVDVATLKNNLEAILRAGAGGRASPDL